MFIVAKGVSARLPPEARARLAKLLGMGGSSHDGEAANAVRLADRLLREHGLRWPDLLDASGAGEPRDQAAARSGAAQDSWREAAAACRRRPALFTAWEREFLDNISRFPRLSAKQSAILSRLAERCAAGSSR